MTTYVTISPRLHRRIAEVAHHRATQPRTVNYRMSAKTDREIHAEGLAGEVAVNLWFCLDPEEYALVDRIGGDNGVDMVLPGATATIQIKSRYRPGYDLLFARAQPLRCDYAILAEGHGTDGNPVRIVGYCTRDEWIARRECVNLGYGDTWMYRRHRLKSMDDFLREM